MKQQLTIPGIFLLLLFSSYNTSAQLCQGSLGDPVVNITFGSGANPGAPLFGLTNYTYFGGDCPDDGSYTLANATSNCFNFTWHNVPEDHTPGDVNGYMMVVNASFSPGVFFVKTVDGLCPNTTYEFAAWIMNVLIPSACGGAGIKPNITFTIETTSGMVLQTYQTGDIPATSFPVWKQYGFFFSTAAATNSVVIRMTNNAPGGCGNDLLLDDITFRPCGPLVTASIVGSPNSVDVCADNNSVYTLQATISPGYNDPVYQWQVSTDSGASWTNIAGANGITYIRQPVYTPSDYLYRFAVSERSNMNISSCSILSNVVSIRVNKLPVVAASNRGNCTGDTLFLIANDGITFSWSGPMNFTSTMQFPFIPNVIPSNSGTYYVQVTSDKGCTGKDSTTASISARPTVNAGNDAEICEGTGIQLHGSGTNITSYQWSPAFEISDPAIPAPLAFPKETTLYTLTVANSKCKASDTVLITVDKKPRADAGPDKVIISGQSVILNGSVSGTAISYTWSPTTYMIGSGTVTPSVSPPVNQVYTLQVTSGKGCGTATDDVLVKVFKEVYVPNAFSPNGDGINDTWNIETLQAYPGAEVKVFNRFGELVFDNNGTNKQWDGRFKGRLLQVGVYVYMIDLKNGSPLMKGVVLLLL